MYPNTINPNILPSNLNGSPPDAFSEIAPNDAANHTPQ